MSGWEAILFLGCGSLSSQQVGCSSRLEFHKSKWDFGDIGIFSLVWVGCLALNSGCMLLFLVVDVGLLRLFA